MSAKFTNKVVAAVVGFFFIVVLIGSFGPTVQSGHLSQSIPIAVKVQPASVVNASAIPTATSAQQVKLKTTLTDVSFNDNLWVLAWHLPSLLIVFALVFLAVRFAVVVAGGKPFDASNIFRLRAIAVLLFISPFVKLGTDAARKHLVEQSPMASIPLMPITLNTIPFLIAIAAFLVSEAFAAGHRATKEVEGLI